MLVTLDTSHLEMSPLKVVAPENMLLISLSRDTSHSPIGPCGLSAQSFTEVSLRHDSTAILSSALERGEKAGGFQALVEVGRADDDHARVKMLCKLAISY